MVLSNLLVPIFLDVATDHGTEAGLGPRTPPKRLAHWVNLGPIDFLTWFARQYQSN